MCINLWNNKILSRQKYVQLKPRKKTATIGKQKLLKR